MKFGQYFFTFHLETAYNFTFTNCLVFTLRPVLLSSSTRCNNQHLYYTWSTITRFLKQQAPRQTIHWMKTERPNSAEAKTLIFLTEFCIYLFAYPRAAHLLLCVIYCSTFYVYSNRIYSEHSHVTFTTTFEDWLVCCLFSSPTKYTMIRAQFTQ